MIQEKVGAVRLTVLVEDEESCSTGFLDPNKRCRFYDDFKCHVEGVTGVMLMTHGTGNDFRVLRTGYCKGHFFE